MYNRYVPQPDGSYQRNWVRDPQPPKPPPSPEPAPPPPPPPKRHPPRQEPAGSFLRQLLPREIDTADLLIILLLLLMAGDREEERSNALLTLALYFLM